VTFGFIGLMFAATGCHDGTPTTPDFEIEVQFEAEKTAYFPGEPVVVTLTNQSRGSIYVWNCPAYLQRRAADAWVTHEVVCSFTTVSSSEVSQWGSVKNALVYDPKLPAGEYRYGLILGTLADEPGVVVYSNTFEFVETEE